MDKPRLLAISKSDLIDDELKTMIIDDLDINIPYVFFSSAAQIGITELHYFFQKLI